MLLLLPSYPAARCGAGKRNKFPAAARKPAAFQCVSFLLVTLVCPGCTRIGIILPVLDSSISTSCLLYFSFLFHPRSRALVQKSVGGSIITRVLALFTLGTLSASDGVKLGEESVCQLIVVTPGTPSHVCVSPHLRPTLHGI